jgi:hypothetical protein
LPGLLFGVILKSSGSLAESAVHPESDSFAEFPKTRNTLMSQPELNAE